MKLSEKGFTLVEVLVIVAIIATLTAFSLPSLSTWMRNADYRSTAREIAQQLRQARSSSVSQNREHRVEFNIANSRLRMMQGNRASNSSAWTVVNDWISYPGIATMRYGVACNLNAADQFAIYRPNGTTRFLPSGADTDIYVCVMEAASPMTRRWRIGVPLATTGRVVVER